MSLIQVSTAGMLLLLAAVLIIYGISEFRKRRLAAKVAEFRREFKEANLQEKIKVLEIKSEDQREVYETQKNNVVDLISKYRNNSSGPRPE